MKRTIALAATLMMLVGLMAGTAHAQDYVPSTPPEVSQDSQVLTFTDLVPGQSYSVAYFNAAGAQVGTVTQVAPANGVIMFAIPAAAQTAQLTATATAETSAPVTIPRAVGYTSAVAPPPSAAVSAPASNPTTGLLVTSGASSLARPRPSSPAAQLQGVPPLAVTGGNVAEPLVLGLALIAVGGVVTMASRRRTA